MRIIEIKNDKLKPIKQESYSKNLFADVFFDYNNPEIIYNKQDSVVFNDIDFKNCILHKNYADYLEIAYKHDYGIVVSPNHIWFTVLCSIAKTIKDDAELFRDIFTDSEVKKEIQLDFECNNSTMIEMDIEAMFKQILTILPSKISPELIIPNISTSTTDFRLACAASFLDTISPYYDYRFCGCGYNKIKILGNLEDYEILINNISELCKISPKLKFLYKYEEGLSRIIKNYDDDKFWERILWTETEYLADKKLGWFMDFVKPESDFAVVKYKEMLTKKEYALCTGIFSSEITSGYLYPHFNKFIVEL